MISEQDRDWIHDKLNEILDKVHAEAKSKWGRYSMTGDHDWIIARIREEFEKI